MRIPQKLMCCYRPYCCQYCCWLVFSISGILAIAGLPSAVDVCDIPIVSAAVA